jgi:hypothetical protein
MMFRFRGDRVNVVRTQYMSDTQRPKQTFVGSLSKHNPEVGAKLKAACTAEEIAEIEDWIDSYEQTQRAEAELNVRRLPEKMASAAEWIAALPADEAARLGSNILAAWPVLSAAIKKTIDA